MHRDGHYWEIAGQGYSSTEISGPLILAFEDYEGAGIGPFGPYERLHVADAVMRDEHSVVAAYTDQTLLWQHMPGANWWPVLRLRVPVATRMHC